MFHVISIHALVKRATKILKIPTGATFISIHALVKRATENGWKGGETKYFNPRPRKEGDTSKHNDSPKGRNFNPRPRKEGDYLYGGL